MLKKLASFVVVLTLMVVGFSVNVQAEIITLTIKEEKVTCSGVGQMSCYQVKYKNSADWENFSSNITGFHYVPGYRYVILVNRTKKQNVPADASIYNYQLKKIVKKTKIPKAENNSWNYVTKNKWALIQMDGVEQPESPVRVKFDLASKKINGFAGCNTFFGSYDLSEGSISFTQMGSTMIGCSDETVNKVEHNFLRLISGSVFKYDVAEQTLNLYQDDRLVLMFGVNNSEEPQ